MLCAHPVKSFAGIYFIMAISTFWVLIQRSRTSESGRISPVILCCSAILFVSLTIVRPFHIHVITDSLTMLS
jgi:uncharacterized membrane protein